MKVAVITCYFDPDYVRSRSIRSALLQLPNVEGIVIKNRSRGFLRYAEIIFRVVWCRLTARPDVYLLNFRGQEILPALLLITIGKPLVFDEFIVPLAWAQEKNRAVSAANLLKMVLARVFAPLYKLWLKQCRAIVTDTVIHAELSARLSGIDIKKYCVLPVGTDELLFKPLPPGKINDNYDLFTVFYYGNMLPLHGLKYVLEAAVLLRDKPIKFVLAGGGGPAERAVAEAIGRGAQIEYRQWVPFNELSNLMHQANLCLGGPFGNTPQAGRIITGKTYQALAAQVPVLIGESQASAMLLDKINCLAVPQADAPKLAESIEWAYANPDKLPVIARAGRELYVQQFSVAIIAQKLAQLLASIS